MPARNNAASIGCSKRRNREAEPLGASASLEATDQKRSPYRPVSASREPVSGAIGSVTSGVRVCTGKSMMKHGETKQSQQSPLLTPGAPGANTDGPSPPFSTSTGSPRHQVTRRARQAPAMILQLVLHNNHNIFMALQSSCGCNILHEVVERRSPACSSTCNDHVQHHRRLRRLVCITAEQMDAHSALFLI